MTKNFFDRIDVDENNNLIWDGKIVKTEQKVVLGRGTKIWGLFITLITVIGILAGTLANLDKIDDNYQKYFCAETTPEGWFCK